MPDATSTSTSTATPTPTPNPNATANPTANPTPNAPPPAPVTAAVMKTPAGEQPLSREGITMVDPGVAFRLEVAAHLTDGRLSLHDEQDAMVASSGTTEAGDGWTRYELVPDEPLRAGSAYALRLEGAAAREAHDPAGKAYAPVVLKLRTTGVRPPAAKAKAKRSRRR
jgi:hypothetical protein